MIEPIDWNEPVCPTVERSGASVSQMVLGLLSTAAKPVTAREIATLIFRVKRNQSDTVGTVSEMVRSVCVCLWTQSQKGLVQKVEPRSWPNRWHLTSKALTMGSDIGSTSLHLQVRESQY